MFARMGGLSRSIRKSEAARKNGLKGGRPVEKVNGTKVNGHAADPDDLPI